MAIEVDADAAAQQTDAEATRNAAGSRQGAAGRRVRGSHPTHLVPMPDPIDPLTALSPARSRAVVAAIVALLLVGCFRIATFWSHDPLYAYANSYDQVRYTACFDLYPDRPSNIPPDDNSPWMPFSDYRFIKRDEPFCYWSSELLFQALNAAIYRISEAIGGDGVHDVRSIGVFRGLALLTLVAAFIAMHWRRHEPSLATAHALLFAVLLADPANTLYLNTFYAEWTSLLAAYALMSLLLLWRDQPGTRVRATLLALLALALSFSKIQHVLLPIVLGVVVFAIARRQRRSAWRAWALVAGGAIAAIGQGVQLSRDGVLMESIRIHNQTHVALMGLLLVADVDERDALIREMGIEPDCVRFVGQRAWQLPGVPEKVCPGVEAFGRGKELAILLRHPAIGLRLFARGVASLKPWIAPGIGQVEDGRNARVPTDVPNLGAMMVARPGLYYGVLALPLLGLVGVLASPRLRRRRFAEFTLLVVATMVATLGVTILGDGLADTPKQGHLVANAAVAWLLVALVLSLASAWRWIAARSLRGRRMSYQG